MYGVGVLLASCVRRGSRIGGRAERMTAAVVTPLVLFPAACAGSPPEPSSPPATQPAHHLPRLPKPTRDEVRLVPMSGSTPEHAPLMEFADRWRRNVMARNDYGLARLLRPDSEGLLGSAQLRDWFYGNRDSHRSFFRQHPKASPFVLILPNGPPEYGLVRVCWSVRSSSISWPISRAAWEARDTDHLCVVVQNDDEAHWHFDDETIREMAHQG